MTTRDPTFFSRRRFLLSAGTLGAAFSISPRRLLGDDIGRGSAAWSFRGPVEDVRRAAANDPVIVQKLRGNVSLLTGQGGNIAAFTGRDGVLLIDSGIVGPKVAAAVATLTRRPIRRVINTHWHFDHTDANAWLNDRGATIIAHTNTRKRLSTNTRVEAWNFTFPPAPKGALATIEVTKEHALEFNGSRVAMKHYGPSHTDTDICVHLSVPNVLVTGDAWWNGMYPFIDYSTGGSIDGLIGNTEATLSTVSAGTVIIPGHGAPGSKDALQASLDMLVAVRDRVARAKAQGLTIGEVSAARPTASFDAAWGKGLVSPDVFTRLVYQGV